MEDDTLPSEAEMEAAVASDEKVYIGHFYGSPRHKTQVDFNRYMNDCEKERKKGAKRAKGAGNPRLILARAASKEAA